MDVDTLSRLSRDNFLRTQEALDGVSMGLPLDLTKSDPQTITSTSFTGVTGLKEVVQFSGGLLAAFAMVHVGVNNNGCWIGLFVGGELVRIAQHGSTAASAATVTLAWAGMRPAGKYLFEVKAYVSAGSAAISNGVESNLMALSFRS